MRFDFTVENVFIVHRHDCHNDMSKCPQDLACSELFALGNFLPNNSVKSAKLTVIHHYVDTWSVSEGLVILDDGWTFDRIKESGFILSRFLSP